MNLIVSASKPPLLDKLPLSTLEWSCCQGFVNGEGSGAGDGSDGIGIVIFVGLGNVSCLRAVSFVDGGVWPCKTSLEAFLTLLFALIEMECIWIKV